MSGKKLLVIIFGTLLICSFSAYFYSKQLIKESFDELYHNQNRPEAIRKHKLAGYVWPPLNLDMGYRTWQEGLQEISKRSAVNIFLKDGTSEQEALVLKQELESISGVTKAEYISKTEAEKRYLASLTSQSFRDLYSPGILPASIEVFLGDFSARNEVEKAATNKPYVDQVLQSN